MGPTANIEREIVVISSWTVFGLLGLAFFLEGAARDSLLIGLLGTAAIAGGFICHLIANYAFEQTFKKGEVALGLGVFAFVTSGFIIAWLVGGLSTTSFYTGLVTLPVIAVGFLSFLVTRYGVGGAFRKFDVSSQQRVRLPK